MTQKTREEYQQEIDSYVHHPEEAKKYPAPVKLINPHDIQPSEDFSDKEREAYDNLGLDPVISERLDPNASKEEQHAYHFKNTPMVTFEQEGHVGFFITPYGVYFAGSGKEIPSNEFLEIWREYFAGIHNDLAVQREREELARGPDYRSLLAKYVEQYERLYGINGIEHDSTLLVKDGGFNIKELVALREITEKSMRTDNAEKMNPPNAIEIRRKIEAPSFLERLLERFKPASEPPKDPQ